MLNWANQFSICCFFDSHTYNLPHSSYECLLAAGASAVFEPKGDILPKLHSFCENSADWLFGHVSYDLKNEAGGLISNGNDDALFPVIFFFSAGCCD